MSPRTMTPGFPSTSIDALFTNARHATGLASLAGVAALVCGWAILAALMWSACFAPIAHPPAACTVVCRPITAVHSKG
jgi:hypothetical protein